MKRVLGFVKRVCDELVEMLVFILCDFVLTLAPQSLNCVEFHIVKKNRKVDEVGVLFDNG